MTYSRNFIIDREDSDRCFRLKGDGDSNLLLFVNDSEEKVWVSCIACGRFCSQRLMKGKSWLAVESDYERAECMMCGALASSRSVNKVTDLKNSLELDAIFEDRFGLNPLQASIATNDLLTLYGQLQEEWWALTRLDEYTHREEKDFWLKENPEETRPKTFSLMVDTAPILT